MELYYYTTTDTMSHIITKGDIYATNVRYLNDSDEYINGLREVRNLLSDADEYGFHNLKECAKDVVASNEYQKIKGQVSDIYSISFSESSDLLSQWHMYAKESGVQIKMNFDDAKEYKYYCQPGDNVKNAKTKEFEKKSVYYLTKIGMPLNEYEEDGRKVLDEFQRILDENKEILSTWKMLAPFIKNYGFRQEREVRAVFQANQNELPIAYRNDRGVLKPFLDIEMEKGWPISGIMVGPGRNQNQVFKSICHFLEHTEIKIDRIDEDELVSTYFDGMKEYYLPKEKVEECKNKVLQIKPAMKSLGVTYSEKIRETLDAYAFEPEERKMVEDYIENNYFCEKGIIVNKSKWPYEF